MKKFFVMTLVLCLAGSAKADIDEIAVGVQGGLSLPSLSSSDNTAFTLASWTAGAFVSYGMLEDLFVSFSFSMQSFSGDSRGYSIFHDSLEYTGTLKTNVVLFLPEISAKYLLYGGYSLAPYVEAGLGMSWAIFGSNKLLDENGDDYGLGISDYTEAAFSLMVGVSADYRINNMIFAGIGFYFNWLVNGNTYEYYASIPVKVSYYW